MGKTAQPDWAAMMGDHLWGIASGLFWLALALVIAFAAFEGVAHLWKHIRHK